MWSDPPFSIFLASYQPWKVYLLLCRISCTTCVCVCLRVCVCVYHLKRCKTSNLLFCWIFNRFVFFLAGGCRAQWRLHPTKLSTCAGSRVWSIRCTCYFKPISRSFHLLGMATGQAKNRQVEFLLCYSTAVAIWISIWRSSRLWWNFPGHGFWPLYGFYSEPERCIPHHNSQWQFWARAWTISKYVKLVPWGSASSPLFWWSLSRHVMQGAAASW